MRAFNRMPVAGTGCFLAAEHSTEQFSCAPDRVPDMFQLIFQILRTRWMPGTKKDLCAYLSAEARQLMSAMSSRTRAAGTPELLVFWGAASRCGRPLPRRDSGFLYWAAWRQAPECRRVSKKYWKVGAGKFRGRWGRKLWLQTTLGNVLKRGAKQQRLKEGGALGNTNQIWTLPRPEFLILF